MAAFALTIASGQAVSSAFALTHAGAVAVEVPSHGAGWGGVRLEWASTAGGPTFATFLTPENAAVLLSVWSGAGPGYGAVLTPPTPYGRVVVTNSTTITASTCSASRCGDGCS